MQQNNSNSLLRAKDVAIADVSLAVDEFYGLHAQAQGAKGGRQPVGGSIAANLLQLKVCNVLCSEGAGENG